MPFPCSSDLPIHAGCVPEGPCPVHPSHKAAQTAGTAPLQPSNRDSGEAPSPLRGEGINILRVFCITARVSLQDSAQSLPVVVGFTAH